MGKQFLNLSKNAAGPRNFGLAAGSRKVFGTGGTPQWWATYKNEAKPYYDEHGTMDGFPNRTWVQTTNRWHEEGELEIDQRSCLADIDYKFEHGTPGTNMAGDKLKTTIDLVDKYKKEGIDSLTEDERKTLYDNLRYYKKRYQADPTVVSTENAKKIGIDTETESTAEIHKIIEELKPKPKPSTKTQQTIDLVKIYKEKGINALSDDQKQTLLENLIYFKGKYRHDPSRISAENGPKIGIDTETESTAEIEQMISELKPKKAKKTGQKLQETVDLVNVFNQAGVKGLDVKQRKTLLTNLRYYRNRFRSEPDRISQENASKIGINTKTQDTSVIERMISALEPAA